MHAPYINEKLLIRHNSSFITVKRRNFCKTATALGLSGLTLKFGDSEEISRALENDVVKYVARIENKRTGDGIVRNPIYESTPLEEWIRRYTAVDAKEEIERKLSNKFPTDYMGVEFSPMDESNTGFGARVVYRIYKNEDGKKSPEPSFSEVREEIPKEQEGLITFKGIDYKRSVPVKVKKREESTLDCSVAYQCVEDTDWSNVPGGSPCHKDDSTAGTLNAPFQDPDYGQGIIMSGHVAGSNGVNINQYDDKIGEVKKHKLTNNTNDIDFAFVKIGDSDEGLSHYIVNDRNTKEEYPVKGIVTDDALKNNAGTTVTYYTQGKTTCQLSGHIKSVGGWGDSWVSSTHDADSGDSGGPLFYLSGGDAYIAGVMAEEINDKDGDDCGEDTKSTTAQTVEDKIGGYYT